MKSTKKIAIIGAGYVGKAMIKLLERQYDLLVYDPNISLPNSAGKEEINHSCELAVVCVPTPQSDDGHCDTSIVEDSVAWLKTTLILIKSTIPPGTTKYLVDKYKKQIAFSPEYVGESSYYHPFWTDMIEEPHVVIGGERKTREAILNFILPITGPTKFYALVDSTLAELCKYMENVYYATKVTFANEFYSIAEAFGVSYPELREIWGLDPRVDKMHTSVFSEKRGFGGKCFPKDLAGLVYASKKAGYNPELLDEVQKSNKRFLDMNK